VAGFEVVDPGEPGVLFRAEQAEQQVGPDHVEVGPARHGGMRQQRLGLRGEQHAGADRAGHQRFDAEPVAHQEHPAPGRVVQPERVDAVEAREQGQPPFGVSVQQHLGVAVRGENVSAPFQGGAQLRIVEDLAVAGDGVRAAGHRLHATLVHADDRQPPVSEVDGSVG
jgi:hypothetical protein